MIAIRPEAPADFVQIRRLNELAFGQAMEAHLVEKLQEACPGAVSLVAEEGGHVRGHILLTPAVVSSGGGRVTGMALAPMAVLPHRQREGIGATLVIRSLEILERRGCPFVVLVGHPEYYPRFGFEPASTHGLTCQWEGVPDAAFMVLILDPPAMAGVSGVVAYSQPFSEIG